MKRLQSDGHWLTAQSRIIMKASSVVDGEKSTILNWISIVIIVCYLFLMMMIFTVKVLHLWLSLFLVVVFTFGNNDHIFFIALAVCIPLLLQVCAIWLAYSTLEIFWAEHRIQWWCRISWTSTNSSFTLTPAVWPQQFDNCSAVARLTKNGFR